MLRFDNALGVRVCGDCDATRAEWVKRFVTLFGNASIADQQGAWIGVQELYNEPSILVMCWLDGDDHGPLYRRFVQLCKEYHVGAKQEAVSVEVTIGGRWQAVIVENMGEWEAFESAYRLAFERVGLPVAV